MFAKFKSSYTLVLLLLVLAIFTISMAVWLSKSYRLEKQKVVSDIIQTLKVPDNIWEQKRYTPAQIDSIFRHHVTSRPVYWEIKGIGSMEPEAAGKVKPDQKNIESFLLLIPNDKTVEIFFPVKTGEVIYSMGSNLMMAFMLLIILAITLAILYKYYKEIKAVETIKTDFYNNITHELKTPVAGIIASAELLKDFGLINNPKKKDELLNNIIIEGKRLDKQVQNIIELSVLNSKHQLLNKDQINLVGIIKINLEKYKSQMGVHNIKFMHKIPEQEIVVQGNAQQLENVVSILIDNSIKYAGKGGSIALKYEVKEKNAYIWFTDNGPGIPEDQQPMIFKKFFRVDEQTHKRKGTGLGLYYSKRIMQLHGGDIKYIHSVKGACFRLQIPVIN